MHQCRDIQGLNPSELDTLQYVSVERVVSISIYSSGAFAEKISYTVDCWHDETLKECREQAKKHLLKRADKICLVRRMSDGATYPKNLECRGTGRRKASDSRSNVTPLSCSLDFECR